MKFMQLISANVNAKLIFQLTTGHKYKLQNRLTIKMTYFHLFSKILSNN